MRAISFSSSKGGTGKTSSAVALAEAFARSGARVLLIDLDPSAAASTWIASPTSGGDLLAIFTKGTPLLDLVTNSSAPGVDIIPSGQALAAAEKALAGEVGAETILRSAIHGLPPRWDFILLDPPPTFGLLAISALVAAGEVVVPCEAHPLALSGLAAMSETADLVRDRLNPSLEKIRVLITRADVRTNLFRESLELLRDRFGNRLLSPPIRSSIRLAEAPSHRQGLFTYAPDCGAAKDYETVATQILEGKESQHGDETQSARVERSA